MAESWSTNWIAEIVEKIEPQKMLMPEIREIKRLRFSHYAILWPKKSIKNRFQVRCERVLKILRNAANYRDESNQIPEQKMKIKREKGRGPNPWPK